LPSFKKNLGNIKEVLQATPELNNYPSELWQSTHDFLKAEGFHSQKFAYMISQNPKLLTISHEKIFQSIVGWRSFQFGEKDTINLLERFPELLQIQPSRDIVAKIDTLSNFVGGGSLVYQLLLNSPTVISQSLPCIKEKIEYLRMVMKVPTHEIYKSSVFSCDIMTIKTRHIFLKRLGLYIVKKKQDPNEISKNPQLYQITDTSEKRFATKVCHVSLEEFETFQEIYKRELEEAQEWSDDESYDDKEVRVEEDVEKW
jgi:mTERF domain-containing protein, mitochondrial